MMCKEKITLVNMGKRVCVECAHARVLCVCCVYMHVCVAHGSLGKTQHMLFVQELRVCAV